MRQVIVILVVCGIIGYAGAAIPTTGLKLHLDASSLTGYSNGATVSSWPDSSGNGNDATCSAPGTPSYIANALNGQPAISITGSADISGNIVYEGGSTTLAVNRHDYYVLDTEVHNIKTVAMVFKRTTDVYSSWAPILGGVAGTNPFHGDHNWGTAYFDKDWSDVSVRYSQIWQNGTPIGAGNGGYTEVPNVYHVMVLAVQNGWGTDVTISEIARSPNYTEHSVYGMDVAEIAVYDRFLSGPELGMVTHYMGDKYGIAIDENLSFVEPAAPTDGATDISINVDPSWLSADASWPVDVYLDPNESYVADGLASVKKVSQLVLPSQSADVGTLDNVTTYYWRVDVYEPNTAGVGYILHEGPVWSFETEPPLPKITTQPISQTVDAGTPVEVSITADYVTGYQWYLNGSPVAGATNATLSIPSLGIADEGVYTCEVTNGSGDYDTSDPAVVVSKRLMGWWKLNGDLTDSVDTVVAGALTHDGSIANEPNFAAGIDGSAFEFLPQDNRVLTIADSADYFNFYPQGLTVSTWVNTAQTGWGGVVCKNNSGNTAGFYLEHNGEWLVSGLRGIDGQWYLGDYNAWQLVTLTLDGDTKTVKQYVNGELTVEAVFTVELPLSSANLFFGAEGISGTYSYDGSLDDVKIWSYPLDAVAVAHLYADMTGIPACAGYSAFDVTGPAGVPDCKVDFYDFAAAAAAWLDCNLVPTCIN